MKKNSRPAPKSEDSEPIEVISWDRSVFQKNHSTPQDNDDLQPEEDKVVDFTEKLNVKKSGNEPFWMMVTALKDQSSLLKIEKIKSSCPFLGQLLVLLCLLLLLD